MKIFLDANIIFSASNEKSSLYTLLTLLKGFQAQTPEIFAKGNHRKTDVFRIAYKFQKNDSFPL